jgi:hypothetical protein
MAHEVEDNHNTTIVAKIKPALRVAWMRTRAWHGEEVTIAVRTEMVKDGAKLKLEIYPKGNAVIDTIDNETIDKNKKDKKYKIDWKDKTLPQGVSEFLVKATLTDFALSADSDPLVVDLVPPAFSS